MAVHLPLSPEAQAEARILMLSANNILKPSDGRPVTMPSQDMIIGHYFLTSVRPGEGEGRSFSSLAEAIMAFDRGDLSIGSNIKIRLTGVQIEGLEPRSDGSVIVETTLGRALFNEALPEDFGFVNTVVGKKVLGQIINDLAERYPKVVVASTLDNLKDMGFRWASRSGVTVSISDVQTPPNKAEVLEGYERRAVKIDQLYDRGSVTEDERRQELIDLWGEATAELTEAMQKNFTSDNPIFMMVDSGARGNMTQMRQIAGMRGLVTNPQGEIIPRPIKSNFREGLSVLEYFIASHGARKGLADTALRTADSGYLTRRLVDVSQDVIIRELDCGTERGLGKVIATWTTAGVDEENKPVRLPAAPAAKGATVEMSWPMSRSPSTPAPLAVDAVDARGNVLVAAGTDRGDAEIRHRWSTPASPRCAGAAPAHL